MKQKHCAVWGGRLGEAKTALKDAVTAGFENLGNSIIDAADTWIYDGDSDLGADVAEAYFTDEVEPLFDANPLQETMIQKYLAFFGASGESLEAYNDYRRLKGAGENFIVLKTRRTAVNSHCASVMEQTMYWQILK